MKESAFVDPPWLIEHEGAGYVQVTALLYQIAEQCNGRQTVDEIAARVSESYGKKVSADNVRQLLAAQLIPKGLVTNGDGKVVGSGAAGRSMLAISMRTKEIGPRKINAVTRFFTWLYWPPVLVVMLLLTAGGEAWLYLMHGVGGSLHDALYTPGLILIILAAIVVGAGIHEIGHASALRYGGGEVRGMGAGFYLMYPAFYTDVTDNYRLPRWSRLRTDLGGFYFNLLTAMALMGVYLATGWEFLLLVVVLINFEIIHQLLPLIRLDGYWVLADLTGIPDFFSQMGPFLRRLLPLPWWKGRTLPALKWWGTAVFLLYILAAIPFLTFSVFLMVKGVPRVLATAWDSLGKQQQALGQAQAHGDALGMAGAAGQMLLLALPTLGVLYTLYRLTRAAVTWVWSWSRPTPARRMVGLLGTVAVVLLVAYLWAPQVPFGRARETSTGTSRRPGPLYAAMAANFRPIESNERGTLVDVARNVVATVPARPTPAGTVARGTATPGGSATPGSTPTLARSPAAALAPARTPAPTLPAATQALVQPAHTLPPAASPTTGAATSTTPTAAVVTPASGTSAGSTPAAATSVATAGPASTATAARTTPVATTTSTPTTTLR